MTAEQLQQLKNAFNADYDQQAVTKALDVAFNETMGNADVADIDYATDQTYGFPTEATAANITHIKHIGNYDNQNIYQNIYVFDITLDANCHIARARVNIKKLVTSLMAPYSNAILLFHYADATNKEWRISWVTKGSGNTHTGAAKRYTFLCRKMPPQRTIVDRLSNIDKSSKDLASEITKAFSVEALSDEFFAEYKAFYEDIVQYICGARYVEVKQNKYERKEIEDAQTIAQRGIFAKFESQALKEDPELSKPISETDPKKREAAEKQQEEAKIDAAEKLVRNYVKKLLGRLVFIQFLAKKGWMGLKPTDAWGAGNERFLHNIYNDYQKNSGNGNFVCDVLNKVLFYSLNNTNGKEGCIAICSNNIAGTTYKFPYLNGGLFEETDLDKLHITLPGYFFVSNNIAPNGEEYAADDPKAPKNTLRKFIETEKKKSKKKNGEESESANGYPYSASEGLFEFFERYNFTIDENGSDEAVVGIDPEMLGKIFENLLEDNKDKGAFYTPKPVVEYMCQQSLIAYLQNGVLKGVQDDVLESCPKDEVQKENLAFLKANLADEEKLKPLIEHFVKTKSVEIEDSVEYRQGLGEIVSVSATKEGGESKLKMSIALVSLLNRLLKDVKICDPAIGSGAFPMGLLNELLECREELAEELIKNGREKEVFADNNLAGKQNSNNGGTIRAKRNEE